MLVSCVRANSLQDADQQSIQDEDKNGIQSVDKLLTDLTSGHNKLTHPVFNQTDAVLINVEYDVLIDEAQGQMTISFMLALRWRDVRVKWNPVDYSNIQSVLMAHDKVWKPELRLMNPATSVTSVGYSWLPVRYYADGRAIWDPNGIYEV